MADYIVTKYIDRITGTDLGDTFVEEPKLDRVMVGMLAENRVDERFDGGYTENNTKRFESVPSVSISFIVKKNDKGKLYIKPRGLLFYSTEPDYEKTLAYVIQKYSERDNVRYLNIKELCDKYPQETFYMPVTYKKICIEDVIGEGISIDIKGLTTKTFHLEDEISLKLKDLENKIKDEVRVLNDVKITFFDIADRNRFFAATTVRDDPVSPRWGIDIYCTVTDEGTGLRFLLQMVNKTSVGKERNLGYLPKIFNAGMTITGDENIEFLDIKLDYFKSSYKMQPRVYAVAENTSAAFDKKKNEIYTENIPKYYQMRLITKDELSKHITFDKLLDDPVKQLKLIYNEMQKDYSKCENEYNSTIGLSTVAKKRFSEALDEYNHEINRFKKGIDQIEFKDYVKKAFLYMNKTFKTKLNTDVRPIKGWRLFQIVFIVSMICEVIRSEYKNDNSITEADLEVANLLYFPTGGGKTEAFLGITVFTMFFDRLRGKNYGITAFLKYPLRLLAVQQLDRVLTIVVKANIVRENSDELSRCNPFAVGFFVGQNNTPNKINANELLSDRGRRQKQRNLILESDEETLIDYYRFIDTCPCCGKKLITVRFNRDNWKLEHVCTNPECKMDVLPLLIVDNEIYRYLPSIVVSTIDKMALLGISNDFKSLFGQVKKICPIHGFTSTSKCSCYGCSSPLKIAETLKDPVPTLFIQDELHLVSESLGTFDAHYESFIDYFAKELVPPEHRKQVRFVGATATISMYKEHIQNLYHKRGRRFPCEYPSVNIGEDFYSCTDTTDITRIILGYAPYGRSIIDGMWESVYNMRVIIFQMMHSKDCYKEICGNGFNGTWDDYSDMLFDYWIELVYNNRKIDVGELENALKNQGNNHLESKGIKKFVIEKMTSDTDFQAVRKALFNIQANRKNYDSINLLLATRTISHGVDEDSFNIMYFFGMPNNNAEYIQAYSRTGRKYTGIVIDIIRLMRVRDRSYLKNFVIFHQNKDSLVESVPINRWAKNAIYRTLPGLLAGLVMQYYTTQTKTDSLFYAYKLKKLLKDETISIEDAIEKLIVIYGCNELEKISKAYMEIITEEVNNILNGIKNENFDQKVSLSEAIARFSKDKMAPMRSLRDTEETIDIQI